MSERRFDDPNWIFERKLDGVRAIVVKLDGKLRHPRYLGLRDDKDPLEVVREQA